MPLPTDVVDYENVKGAIIVGGDCTHPAGHCYGSDGGSGIPENLKVIPGQGGEQEVWKIDSKTQTVGAKEVYLKCQYCQKLLFVGLKNEETKVGEI